MIDIFEYNFRRIFFLVNKKLINNYKKKIPFAFFIASLFYMCTDLKLYISKKELNLPKSAVLEKKTTS